MRWFVVAAMVVFCGAGLAAELPEDINGIGTLINSKTLTVQQAEVVAELSGVFFLDGLTTITPEGAETLAKCEGNVVLNGLTTCLA